MRDGLELKHDEISRYHYVGHSMVQSRAALMPSVLCLTADSALPRYDPYFPCAPNLTTTLRDSRLASNDCSHARPLIHTPKTGKPLRKWIG
jgi:hypothetical protein